MAGLQAGETNSFCSSFGGGNHPAGFVRMRGTRALVAIRVVGVELDSKLVLLTLQSFLRCPDLLHRKQGRLRHLSP